MSFLHFKICIFYFAFILLLSACAPTSKLQRPTADLKGLPQLQRQLDAILQDSSLSQTRTGIKIVSLQTDEILYARDNQLLFHPASNMKLLTTAAALRQLGPNFRYQTEVRADTAALADSAIRGNIYLKGYGDPSLRSQDLWGMVLKLKELGVKRIRGDLICDETYFDDLYFGAGWMIDDVSSWYWPPVSALTVNRNCVTVTAAPGTNSGDPLQVKLHPPTAYVKIENFGATVDSTDSLQIKKFKVERKWRQQENTIVIEGGMARHSEPEEFDIEVVEPALYAGALFSEILKSENILFEGKILTGALPDTTTLLATHTSAPLSHLIQHTNKISDNLYAELLLKTIGAATRGAPGTAEKGLFAIRQFFAEIGIDTTAFSLADGSGVSRYNLITPDQIIELLKTMYRDFRVQAEFLASLPIAGVDGTLAGRMKGTAAEGKLRAKTGSLSGVSALAGYTTTGDGEPLAFSIIMQHFVVPTSKIRALQDRIGAAISGFRSR
jgi:PBP4 family serine-type D-alanyl-D-alanine carboxypeptidase